MAEQFQRKLVEIQQNVTINPRTGCHLTNILPYKGHRYPRTSYRHNRKTFQPFVHTFVYFVGNNLHPNGTRPGYEVSHLCHNKFCILLSHLTLEPKARNLYRRACNKRRSCYGHMGPKCMYLYVLLYTSTSINIIFYKSIAV